MSARILQRSVTVFLAIGLAMSAELPIAGHYSAPASEVALLPQFCWWLYMDNVSGPQYTIHDCGPMMNHYCDGLLELQRANKALGVKKRGERLQHLQRAKTNTIYTLNGMKGFPNCHIRQHAETTLKQVNALLNAYGPTRK